jgi:predicted nucleic acid-binding protein
VSTFVDTSALLAVLDADDLNHDAATAVWKELITTETDLVCTNYIIVEAFALIQHRLGMGAVRTFHEDLIPVLKIEWIDAQQHAGSVTAVLIAGRRQLSLVDCSSFETMRSLGINEAFTLDHHFAEQGFHCTP